MTVQTPATTTTPPGPAAGRRVGRVILLVLVLAAAVAVLAAVIGIKTWRYGHDARIAADPAAAPGAPALTLPPAHAIAERLAAAIRFATISNEGGVDRDQAAFAGFQAWLAVTYPRVFAELAVTRLNEHALLLEWPGVDQTRAGALFAAHYDVVPVI
ncbi:MAG: hypothetical protein ACKOBM_07155, partial [Gammaproteobacteria bacterium]